MPKTGLISEGTISLLIGCHNPFFHSLFVLMAWKKEYGEWPEFWEVICILLHDIGHIGKDYISDVKQKREHWILGAKLAGRLFGEKGFLLVAGHSKNSGYPISKLYLPDKKSWLYAWDWWLESNRYFEFKKISGAEWKEVVRANLKSGFPNGLHNEYLKMKGKL